MPRHDAATRKVRPCTAESLRYLERTGASEHTPLVSRLEGAVDAPHLATLAAVESRVLWLATSIVHHANRVRATPSGVKVGGHQASSRLDGVDHDCALLRRTCAAPTASRSSRTPRRSCTRSSTCSARSTRRYLTTLRAFGGLQSYPSRLKDPGPGRLLDRVGRDRRDGADLERAGAPLRRRSLRRPPAGGRSRCVGDAELDEGAIWEAVVDPMVADARRGAVDRRPQPPVARPRRARHRRRPHRRDVRGGRLADDRGQVRAAARGALRAQGGAALRRADRLDAQRGVPAAAPRRRRRAARAAARGRRRRAAVARAGRRPRRRRAAARDPRPRRPRPVDAARGVRRRRRRDRPARR